MKYKLLYLLLLGILLGCTDENDATDEQQEIQDITHKVLSFEYTPDTGNNTSRLSYAIEFSNPNNFEVEGYYKITTRADGIESSLFSSDKSDCYIIAANESCTFAYEAEDSHDLGIINSITLISVEYTIANH